MTLIPPSKDGMLTMDVKLVEHKKWYMVMQMF